MARFVTVLLATSISLIPLANVYAQYATTREDLLGAWKLLSFYDETDTGKRTDPFGVNPRGLMILTYEGRIALTFLNRPREQKGPVATDAEAVALFRSMVAYVGNYQLASTPIDGGLGMTIRSEVSSAPRIEGVDRKFVVWVEGGKMTMKTTPAPVNGEAIHRTLTLERDR
jgi:hypothetical protein